MICSISLVKLSWQDVSLRIFKTAAEMNYFTTEDTEDAEGIIISELRV